MEMVTPPPDRKLIRHRRIEIAVFVVSATAVLLTALYITTVTATSPNPDPADVVLVAWLGATAALAGHFAIVGVRGCLDEIRRARR